MSIEHLLEKFPDSEQKCLRCDQRMKAAGRTELFVGKKPVGALGELFVNRQGFEVEVCPRCGKTEFYL